MASVLHRYTRLTDHKCERAPGQFLWLLTDTPEMGGRLALERISDKLLSRGIRVTCKLDVHDHDGFGQDETLGSVDLAVDRQGFASVPSDTETNLLSADDIAPDEIRNGGNRNGENRNDEDWNGQHWDGVNSNEQRPNGERRGAAAPGTLGFDSPPTELDRRGRLRRSDDQNDDGNDPLGSEPLSDIEKPTGTNGGDDSIANGNGTRQSEFVIDGSVGLLTMPRRTKRNLSRQTNANHHWFSGGSDGTNLAMQSGVADWVRIDRHAIDSPAALPRPVTFASAIKRSMDIVGSTFGLIAFSPVILAAMAAVRLSDGKPALFKQTREGLGGRPFTIYKLRTMTVDAESQQSELRALSHRDGPAFKIDHDPRVTKVGKFLRDTCIDELPQLFNVLRGEMSLVGPRPLPWHESRACSRWQRRRLEIRPGMTCYWQINKASVTSFDEWMRLDLLYLEQHGFREDIKLIVQTVAVPMLGRGGE